jgi:PAS domain S-box-containing protein
MEALNKVDDMFQGFFEFAPDAIIIIDSIGKIKMVNSQAEILLGYKREEIIGKEIEILMPSRYRSVHQGHLKNYIEHPKIGPIGIGKLIYGLHKNGKEFPVKIRLNYITLNEDFLISADIRDITRQNEIDRELKVAMAIAEKAAQIAEGAMKAKQQFLSNMSHEIRTPMTAIIGFSKVLLKTDLTETQKQYLTAIKTSSDSLLVLINDILDLAKVDAGKMTFEQTAFKMESDISAMLNLFDLKFKEKNLELIKEFDCKIPKVLLGDSVRLNQIILNLVSNAIKFTTKGKITVSVRLLKEDEETATIEFAVTDTGIGIPENMISTVFENFQQATSSTARLFGGTGLGLAIVKQLVERQGGTIYVKSKINEGSTFSFILRFQKTKVEIELDSEIVKLNTEIKKIKVLVVEDVPMNQLLMKILLDDFGFERDIAENGKVAIEKLQNKSYDIILMDLQMPEMNGFEATDHIRNKMHSKIPIIALTADVTADDLSHCKAIGMNDHIAKPLDEKLLYNKIVGLVLKP